jgi:lipopolysaccharide assembly outer membrane protein LptD (OstA)
MFFISCSEKRIDSDIRVYAGPILRSENMNTAYLDSGKTKLRIEDPVRIEFLNGNQEYEKGILVTFYKTDTVKQSYLKADFVHYNKQQDLYTAIGHVVLEDVIKHEKLNTEKLHWSRTEGRVFNNEFVEITTPTQILKGKGLTAKQDFSSYTILEPEGQILHADSVNFF